MDTRRMAALAIVVGLTLAACGGSDGGNESSGESAAQAEQGSSYGADDLEALVLGASEAPEDTEYVGDFRSHAVLARTPSDANEVTGAGFIDAYRTEFQTPGKGAVEPGTVFLVSQVILFEDAGGAGSAVQHIVEEFRAIGREGADPVVDIGADGLGEEAFGLQGHFDPFSPDPGVAYVWRIRNLVLGAFAINIAASELMGLAQTMDARAA